MSYPHENIVECNINIRTQILGTTESTFNRLTNCALDPVAGKKGNSRKLLRLTLVKSMTLNPSLQSGNATKILLRVVFILEWRVHIHLNSECWPTLNALVECNRIA